MDHAEVDLANIAPLNAIDDKKIEMINRWLIRLKAHMKTILQLLRESPYQTPLPRGGPIIQTLSQLREKQRQFQRICMIRTASPDVNKVPFEL
jgi:hypothetical protein